MKYYFVCLNLASRGGRNLKNKRCLAERCKDRQLDSSSAEWSLTVIPYELFRNHLTFIPVICSNRYSALSWFNPTSWKIFWLQSWWSIYMLFLFWFKTWNLQKITLNCHYTYHFDYFFTIKKSARRLIFSVCLNRSHQFSLVRLITQVFLRLSPGVWFRYCHVILCLWLISEFEV